MLAWSAHLFSRSFSVSFFFQDHSPWCFFPNSLPATYTVKSAEHTATGMKVRKPWSSVNHVCTNLRWNRCSMGCLEQSIQGIRTKPMLLYAFFRLLWQQTAQVMCLCPDFFKINHHQAWTTILAKTIENSRARSRACIIRRGVDSIYFLGQGIRSAKQCVVYKRIVSTQKQVVCCFDAHLSQKDWTCFKRIYVYLCTSLWICMHTPACLCQPAIC